MALDPEVETLTAEPVGEGELGTSRSALWSATQLRRRVIRERVPHAAPIIEEVVEASPRSLRWPSAYLLTFIGFVLVPAIAASLYFAFLASDQFVVESRFAVSATRNDIMSEKLKSSAAAVGYSTASQDAYIVSDYIKSRAIIDDLSHVVDLRTIFSRPEADFWARLKTKATAEEFTDYWRDMVDSYVDGPSGIVTVTVRAFRPEDALAIGRAIVAVSEVLANQISARARADMTKLAETEVANAEKRVATSLEDMRAFRDSAGFVDPQLTAVSSGTLLTELLSNRIAAQGEYLVAGRSLSPDAPSMQTMKARLNALDSQIAEEKAKMTSATGNEKSLASLLPKFEELALDNQVAAKIYELAAQGLERARLRAAAQTVYVTVFVPPAMPQEAKFPERIGLSIVIAIALCVIWGIGALTAAVVEDHRV